MAPWQGSRHQSGPSHQTSGREPLTSSLKDKVDLHRVVFIGDSVFARRVEMELRKLVLLLVERDSAVGLDLKCRALVLKLTTFGEVGDVEVNALSL